jgi:hypothetical protein
MVSKNRVGDLSDFFEFGEGLFINGFESGVGDHFSIIDLRLL